MTPEQEQKLNTIAIDLFDYADEVKMIKDLFEVLPEKRGIASPYLNFRDALFHYKKMYETAMHGDEYGFIQQCACVEEHLNRGLKDFAIHLCNNYYVRIIHKMITFKEKSSNKSAIKALRSIYHNMKNLIVDIRLTGQTLQHFNSNRNTWLKKMVDIIEAFDDFLNINPLYKRLYHQFSKERD